MERKQHLKPYYYKRPNVLKYHEIMNTHNKKKKKKKKKKNDSLLKNLCRFIDFFFYEKCTLRNVAKKAYCKVCIIMNVYVHWITLSYLFHISIHCMLLVRVMHSVYETSSNGGCTYYWTSGPVIWVPHFWQQICCTLHVFSIYKLIRFVIKSVLPEEKDDIAWYQLLYYIYM